MLKKFIVEMKDISEKERFIGSILKQFVIMIKLIIL